jgi:hypothetical protein
MSTPHKQNRGSSPPPPTPGWTQGLFGSWLSSTKRARVESGTESTVGPDREGATPNPNGRRPRPQIDILSPSYNVAKNGTGGTSSKANTYLSATNGTQSTSETTEEAAETETWAPRSAVLFASPTDFDGNQASRDASLSTAPTALAEQSPWKSNNNVGFAVNLKRNTPFQSSDSNRRRFEPFNAARSPLRHEAMNLQGRLKRKKMMPGGFLSINRKRHLSKVDAAAMSSALENALTGISASTRNAEHMIYQAFKPGNERTRRSRLPLSTEELHAAEAVGTANITGVAPSIKRRRVQFGNEGGAVVATPANKKAGNHNNVGGKRKATPYKVSPATYDDGEDDDGDDDYGLQITSDGIRADQLDQTRCVMPDQNELVGEAGGEWSSLSVREAMGSPIAGSYLLPGKFLPSAPGFDTPGYPLRPITRFKEMSIERLFVEGEKGNNDGNAQAGILPGGPDPKRMKVVAQYKCEHCGHLNNDDETFCENCGKSRPKKEPIGWGNLFKDQENMLKCPMCTSLNPAWVTICRSCEYNFKKPAGAGDSGTPSTPGAAQASAAGSIGTSGFSFPAPQSQPENGSAPAASVSTGSSGLSLNGASAPGLLSQPSNGPAPGTVGPSGFTFTGPSASGSNSQPPSGLAPPASGSNSTSSFPAIGLPGSIGAGGFVFGGGQASASQPLSTTDARHAPEQLSQPSSGIGFVPAVSTSTTSSGHLFDIVAPVSDAATSANGPFSFGSAPPGGTGFVFGAGLASPQKADDAGASKSSATSVFGSTSNESQPSKGVFGTNTFGQGMTNSASKVVSEEPASEPTFKRSRGGDDGERGSGSGPGSNTLQSEKKPFPSLVSTNNSSKPTFSFGSTTGNSHAPQTKTKFTFGGDNSSSIQATPSTAAQTQDSFPRNVGEGSQEKKRRNTEHGDDGQQTSFNKFKAQSQDAKTFSGQVTTTNSVSLFGSTAPMASSVTVARSSSQVDGTTTTPAPAPASVPLFGQSVTSSGAPTLNFFGAAAKPSNTPSTTSASESLPVSNPPISTFGSSTTPSLFGDTPAPGPSFGAASSSEAPTLPFGTTGGQIPAFGSVPAKPFGSTLAPTTSGSYGSAPPPAAFGSNPAVPQFGSTQASDASSFGSTLPPTKFGSATGSAPFGSAQATPTPFVSRAPGAAQFGAPTSQAAVFGTSSTPAAPFVSTPAPAFGAGSATQTPAPFGSTAAPTTQPFGATSVPVFGAQTPASGFGATPAAGPFGATPATAQFGESTTTPGGGFGSGAFGQPQAMAQGQPNGFVGNPFNVGSATPNVDGGFQIGTGGSSATSRGSARRRIVKARRPGGSRQA